MSEIKVILEQRKYPVGEKVKGIIMHEHVGNYENDNRSVKSKMKFRVIGEESITVVINRSETRSTVEVPYRHNEKNQFFEKIMDEQLNSLGTPTNDGYLQIEYGRKEIPFEFVLESDKELLPTYESKNIKIRYNIFAEVKKETLLHNIFSDSVEFTVVCGK